MAINFNGTNINKVIYNGVELNKVIYNGVTVYESIDFTKSYFYIRNTTGSTFTLNLRLNAKAVPIEVHFYKTGNGYTNPNTPATTITSTSSKKKLALKVEPDYNYVVEFVGGKWEYYSGGNPLFYDHKDCISKAILGSNCVNAYYQFNNASEYPNLEEIIFAAAPGSPLGLANLPKLTKLTLKTTPEYFSQINELGVSEFTFPESITSAPEIRDCPNLKVIHNYCPLSVYSYAFGWNEALEHIYMYNYNPSSNNLINSASSGWVAGCNPNVIIHLPKAIVDITTARTKFGPYFNYIDSTTQATVLFDL